MVYIVQNFCDKNKWILGEICYFDKIVLSLIISPAAVLYNIFWEFSRIGGIILTKIVLVVCVPSEVGISEIQVENMIAYVTETFTVSLHLWFMLLNIFINYGGNMAYL